MFFETHCQLGGHLSCQLHSSSCWFRPYSPYPNLWLNTRCLRLERLRLVFEEIVNRNRLTEQHFIYHPNSECSHPFGNFVDDSSNFHRKRHWTIVVHLFLFADFRDGQRLYTIIYLTFIFLHVELLRYQTSLEHPLENRGKRIALPVRLICDTMKGDFARVFTTWTSLAVVTVELADFFLNKLQILF